MRLLFKLLVALAICLMAHQNIGFGQEYFGENLMINHTA